MISQQTHLPVKRGVRRGKSQEHRISDQEGRVPSVNKVFTLRPRVSHAADSNIPGPGFFPRPLALSCSGAVGFTAC